MVNNIGKTTLTLTAELGRETSFTSSDDITIITGELGAGFLLFDPAGTIGVISNFTSETDFVVTTHALSIDVQTILSLSY